MSENYFALKRHEQYMNNLNELDGNQRRVFNHAFSWAKVCIFR